MITHVFRLFTAAVLFFAATFSVAAAAEKTDDPYRVSWKEPQARGNEIHREQRSDIWGVAKQGDVRTKFLRILPYYYGSYELQEIHKNDTVEYLFHVQDETGSDGTVPRLTIGTKEDTAFELTPVPAAEIMTRPSKDYTDYWYRVDDLTLWTALEDPAKRGKVNAYFYTPSGHMWRVDISALVKKIPCWLALSIDECPAYGPMYSVFFPGMPADELREAVAYRTNAHHPSGRPKTSNKFIYSDVGDLPTFATHPALSREEVHYVTFREEPSGTWVNWDYWGAPTGNVHPLDTVSNITQAVYLDLYPTKYYGFTLQGHPEKPRWIIDTIDTKTHPELAVMSKGDVIKSLNGIPVDGYPKYVAEYLMWYSALSELNLVLENKKTGLYEITVHSGLILPTAAIDYKTENEKAKHLRFTKESIIGFRIDSAVPFEIFDPLGTPEVHVESPCTDWILDHFHTHRPDTRPLAKFFTEGSSRE
jgi:hypothetical protein